MDIYEIVFLTRNGFVIIVTNGINYWKKEGE